MAQIEGRRYWVVSPNVIHVEKTVSTWHAASVARHMTFMGYGPDDHEHGASGYKFAHEVKPRDVILIARRHAKQPEIVGLGVVRGEFQKPPKGDLPAKPGSARRLSPFLPRSRAAHGVPLMAALTHTKALAELHPTRTVAHKKLVAWIDEELKGAKRPPPPPNSGGTNVIRKPLGSFREDYTVRSPARVRTAKKKEAALVERYRRWLERHGDRTLETVLYKKLRCDGYEQARRNLIEAKSSNRREHLRMAVGQLFDYEHQGKQKLGVMHKAVLVPQEPARDEIAWLKSLNISVIWRKNGEFLDSANGQFT
jgi:hypothetical protein